MRVFTYCGGCKKYVWEMVGVGCPDCVQRIKDKAERNRKLLEDIERLEQEDFVRGYDNRMFDEEVKI